MPYPYRRRRGPKPDRRRALELLAASPEGCTEALMFANGFTAELLVELATGRLHVRRAKNGSPSVHPMLTTHGRYRLGSATRISSTPCVRPSCRRIGSRTSGADRSALETIDHDP